VLSSFATISALYKNESCSPSGSPGLDFVRFDFDDFQLPSFFIKLVMSFSNFQSLFYIYFSISASQIFYQISYSSLIFFILAQTYLIDNFPFVIGPVFTLVLNGSIYPLI
jgi:hypothetical protein